MLSLLLYEIVSELTTVIHKTQTMQERVQNRIIPTTFLRVIVFYIFCTEKKIRCITHV